ncbi:MAG: carboxypeptidase-like regulatory domain-containing protein [Bacteroidales bacterium]
MKGIVLLSMTLLVLTLLSSVSCSENEQVSVEIIGRVIDKETREGIPDVSVGFPPYNDIPTLENGSFEIKNVAPQSEYVIRLEKDNYSIKFDTIKASNQSLIDFRTIELERNKAVLYGTVVDKITGDKLPNIRVRFSAKPLEVRTEQDGTFRIEGIEPRSSYSLEFHGNGYAFASKKMEDPGNNMVNFDNVLLNTTTSLDGLGVIEINGLKAYVLPVDLGELMTHSRAVSSCKDNGSYGYNRWKLPNQDELNQIYLKKNDIGGFYDNRDLIDNNEYRWTEWTYYWADGNSHSDYYYYVQDFSNGYQKTIDNSGRGRCRCIMYAPDQIQYISNWSDLDDDFNWTFENEKFKSSANPSKNGGYIEFIADINGTLTFTWELSDFDSDNYVSCSINGNIEATYDFAFMQPVSRTVKAGDRVRFNHTYVRGASNAYVSDIKITAN